MTQSIVIQVKFVEKSVKLQNKLIDKYRFNFYANTNLNWMTIDAKLNSFVSVQSLVNGDRDKYLLWRPG
jgi:hypothetical protein